MSGNGTRRMIAGGALGLVMLGGGRSISAQAPTPLDRYIEEAQRAGRTAAAGPGSLYAPRGPLAELGSDPRALQVNDLITITVAEQVSALSSGATSSARKSSATAGISALHGVASPKLANLVGTSRKTTLDGQGTTSRTSNITTTLSARVTQVLPNGYLVVEANKDVVINAERQLITVRGVVRPVDLGRDNSVSSNRVAEMEIRVNGRGVVNDSIKRPFFLYRLLLGILPF